MNHYFSGNRSYPYRRSVARLPWDPLYDTREQLIAIGPLVATQEARKMIPLSPVLGGPILAAGIVLVIVGVKRP